MEQLKEAFEIILSFSEKMGAKSKRNDTYLYVTFGLLPNSHFNFVAFFANKEKKIKIMNKDLSRLFFDTEG